MKIAVVCASGKAGRLIVSEAMERGADYAIAMVDVALTGGHIGQRLSVVQA